MHGGGRREEGQDLAWLCHLAGLGSATLLSLALQTGPQRPAVVLGLGKALGVPVVGVGLHADPFLQKSCVSTRTGIWLHIPSQSSRDVNFQKGGVPCGFMSVILGFKLFMHEK